MTTRKLKKLDNLANVSKIVQVFGHYTEFKLYEKSLKHSIDYEDAEKLSNFLSFIKKDRVLPSDLLSTHDEKTNQLIESYNKLKLGYSELKLLGLNKKESNQLFSKLSKTILKLPNYYLSIPMNCDDLSWYIIGFLDKDEFLQKFKLLSIFGEHQQMKPRVFYKIYTDVLFHYTNIINQKKNGKRHSLGKSSIPTSNN
jgi:hypothetical protein